MARRPNSEFHISWMTITYRSLTLAVVTVLLLAGVVAYLLLPGSVMESLTNRANEVFAKFGFTTVGKHAAAIGPQQAHFTALDGTVRVKKSTGNSWVSADFNVPLEKGDVVQTSSEGMAKVFFPDGTSYTVKPDSLILIEENSANEQQQTQVSVQVTTGTVDLSTATYGQGSTSQVVVAGATASFAPESSAMVHNDPRADQHEILLKKGSGRVTRKSQAIVLSQYEKVSFRNDSQQMSRTKQVGPPTLITPAGMAVVYAGKAVHFSWTPAGNSRGYRLRVSRNPYFSSTVFDKLVPGTDTELAGLKEGAYYWVVTSHDARGRESIESERSQFTIVLRAPDVVSLLLDLEPLVQHGHVIEVKGKTDPSARVMVNGQEVPIIRPDGGFSFFTSPLPNGENVITVTAQNARGGVKTQQKKVVIE